MEFFFNRLLKTTFISNDKVIRIESAVSLSLQIEFATESSFFWIITFLICNNFIYITNLLFFTIFKIDLVRSSLAISSNRILLKEI